MKKLIIYITILLSGSATALYSFPGSGEEIIFTDVYKHPDSLSKAQISQSFGLLDDLYLWVKLDKPLTETYEDLNIEYQYGDEEYTFNYALRFYVNGEELSSWLFEMPVRHFNNATLIDFVLNSSDKSLETRFSYTVNNWNDMVSEMKGGVYDIDVEFVPLNGMNLDDDPSAIASGRFQLVVNPSEMDEFTKSNEVLLPKPTVINEGLERQIISATDRVYPNMVPQKAIITDLEGDWSYGADDAGNIIRRYLIATVVLKNTLDGSCIVRSAVYYQKHKGYGIFGDMFYLKPATGYYDYMIPCDLVSME